MNAGANPIRRLRLILLPAGALLLAGLLLFTWMNALAANAAEPALSEPAVALLADSSLPAAEPPAAIALPVENAASEGGQNGSVKPAPLQQNVDYTITPVGSGIFTFTLGTSSNNTYIFAIGSTNWVTNSIPIIVNYPLPEGITWTPANSGNWNCLALSNNRLARCIYNLPGARNFDLLYINVSVTRNAISGDTNTVTLEVTDPPNQGNNSAPVTTVVDSVDLGITKSVVPGNVIVNGVVTYTVVITDVGPAVSRGVVVVDNIPREYLSCVGASVPGGTTYQETTGRWDVGNGPIADAGLRLIIRCTAQPAANGRLVTNSASVSSANAGDWNPANNTATASIVVGGLTFTKAADRANARAGEPVLFVLHVENPTVSTLTNVQITDLLMPGFDFVSARVGATNVGSYSSSSRTFSYFRGNMNQNTVFDVLLTVRPSTNISATMTITNAATISWGSGSSRVVKTTDPIEIFASPGGWLQVGSTNAVTRVTPGEYISYTVSVTNTGSLRVDNIVLSNTFEANVVALSIDTNSIGSGSCTQVFCRLTLFDGLDPREKVSYRIAARVNTAAVDNDLVRMRTRGRGTDPNAIPADNTFVEDDIVDVVAQPDLVVTKSVRPSQAQVGESFTFRIDVTNEGNTTVDELRIGDEFVSVLDLTNVTTSRGTATLNTGARTIDVNVGDLQPGQKVRVEVVAKVNTTATDIESYENVARLRYTGGSMRSKPPTRFRVLPAGGTLPGTGWSPARRPPSSMAATGAAAATGGEAADSDPLATAAAVLIGVAVIAGGLGLLLLVIGLYVRIRRPLYSGGYMRTGLILTILGIASFACGWVLFPASNAPATQLGILRGDKPPLATRVAILPSATVEGVQPAQGSEAPGGVLPGPAETEPSFEPALPGEAPTNTPDPSIAQFEPTPTPLTLPNYPVPQPTAMVSQGPGGIEPDASQVTRLVIPKLGLDTVVRYVPFNGDTWLIGGLRNEIAWMGNTSWPGLGGNTGLAGHVDLADGSSGPFYRLSDLAAGDQVQVYTEKYVYTYVVSAESVVNDHDLTVVDPTTNAQVTLITCTGWDPDLRVYLQRLIVTASLSSVQQSTTGN